jgi:hypothetical protein
MSKTLREMLDELIMAVPFTNAETRYIPKIKVALEKQMPKKPIIHGYREGREINTISFTCPICNKHIGRENFCKHCGQAIDWSDTE